MTLTLYRPILEQSRSWRDRLLPYFLVLFILGWVSDAYSIFDISRYSFLLIYFAALPFCLYITSRTMAFFALPAISTIFSAVSGLLQGVPLMSVFSQATLQMLALGFAAGVAAINWQKHLSKFAKILSIFACPVVIYGGYQMIARAGHWANAFLPVTNQQAYALGGYQRGWEKPVFTRASSLFVEPSDFGYFCLWVLALGLSLDKGRWRYFCLGLAFSGILFSQSLSAVLGVGILVMVYLVTSPINLAVIRQVVIVVLFSGLALLSIEPLMPEAFAKFFNRVQEAVSLDERADSGRVDHLPACWQIYKDAPSWGHGLASLNSADANGSDVTSVAYALLLMERGTIGTLFFMFPWLYIAIKSITLPADNRGRIPGLMLSALHLYCFSTFSLAYFLPFWLSLGIASSLVARTYEPVYRSVFTGSRRQYLTT